ncbi:MAG: fluoride efflux transporter CrcB [Chitinophagaceae bacterium]|nr:fluoride efflux transporter CrcB [Chitinophagaceae bacterium]
MLWKHLLLVALGGGVGSVARFLGQKWLAGSFNTQFPYGTLFVNILGCLLIGLIYGLASRHEWMNPEWRILLMTGFCGGFTTFSAFTLESMGLLQEQKILPFFIYLFTSVAIGLAATFAGYWITR